MRPGQVIHGRYEIERTLASGGMATVYVARHIALGSQHAVKLLHLPSPEIRERLLLEGRLQARLRHPNIVVVTDILDVDHAPALVMELVEGPALDEWLDEHRPTLDEAEKIFMGILAGVDHAHKHGVVHRDLKPANVLLAPMPGGFQPKVADFGIAKVVEEVLEQKSGRLRTRTGLGMGTPCYMAPEQTHASTVGPAADVFALGAILYELALGRRAFQGESYVDILAAARDGQYDDPADVQPDLPLRVVQAIRGALAPSLDERIADCTTLVRVLSEGKVSTLSGIGPVVASAPLELPKRSFPRGLGSSSGRGPSQETYFPVEEKEQVEPPPEPSASDSAPPPPEEPPLSEREEGAPIRYDEPWDRAPTRRGGIGLLLLWFLIFSGVVGLALVALGLIVFGVTGLAWWGIAALEDLSESPPIERSFEAGERVESSRPLAQPRAPTEAGASVLEERGLEERESDARAGEPAPVVSDPPAPVKTDPEPVPPSAPAPSTDEPPPALPTESPPSPSPSQTSKAPRPAPPPPAEATSEPAPAVRSSASDPIAPSRRTVQGWTVELKRARTVRGVQQGVFKMEAAPGRILLLLDVAITNGTRQSRSPTAPFTLSADGVRYEIDMRCRLATSGALEAIPSFPAGQTVAGTLCFELPERASPEALLLAPGRGEPTLRLDMR
ncbi:MAG: serine/threonine protein kinase [Deltaproteobacteria bacterium]|nr:MAG: serine/threonine protein kinase [Deltaproteobacteria bacterium]